MSSWHGWAWLGPVCPGRVRPRSVPPVASRPTSRPLPERTGVAAGPCRPQTYLRTYYLRTDLLHLQTQPNTTHTQPFGLKLRFVTHPLPPWWVALLGCTRRWRAGSRPASKLGCWPASDPTLGLPFGLAIPLPQLWAVVVAFSLGLAASATGLHAAHAPLPERGRSSYPLCRQCARADA